MKKSAPKNKKTVSLPKLPLTRIFYHWATIAVLCLFLTGFIVYGTSWAYAKTYEERIYPGVSFGVLELGGLTPDEAKELLGRETVAFLEKGFTINYDGDQFNLNTNLIIAEKTENSRELIKFDIESMVSEAYSIGRGFSWWNNVRAQAVAKTVGTDLQTEIAIDEKSLLTSMKEYFGKYDAPAENAQILITFSDSGNPIMTVEPEHGGNILDYDAALAEMESQLMMLESADITLAMIPQEPEIVLAEAEPMVDEIEAALGLAPITLTYSTNFEDFTWDISKEQFATWLTLEKNESGKVEVSILKEALLTTMENITGEIEVEPTNAKFVMEEERVVEFEGSRDGVEIDWDTTLEEFKNAIIKNGESTAEIKVSKSEPEIKLEDLNDLGIRELIGVGRSDFSGSPTNRRHNIRVGADKLNGMLIAPEEEFTTITNLSPVTAANGYLPELVIKENKTIPEYGGGLCQIGTTMFRVALSAGLPITERHPHSYRVVYYEPAGKDAAVYEMHPDVRFINDTGHHILIQTHIYGDELVFEFWGTNDGREVYQSDSRIYNITSPPALKEVETTELAPGERKCTESAHAGADAEFDYKVTYPDGEVMEETFTSHYRAWGAVCLIGVEELSEPAEGEGGEEGGEEPAEKEVVIPE